MNNNWEKTYRVFVADVTLYDGMDESEANKVGLENPTAAIVFTRQWVGEGHNTDPFQHILREGSWPDTNPPSRYKIEGGKLV